MKGPPPPGYKPKSDTFKAPLPPGDRGAPPPGWKGDGQPPAKKQKGTFEFWGVAVIFMSSKEFYQRRISLCIGIYVMQHGMIYCFIKNILSNGFGGIPTAGRITIWLHVTCHEASRNNTVAS